MHKPLGGDWARHPDTSCRWIEDGHSVSVRCSSFRPGRLSLRRLKLAHRKSTPLGRNTAGEWAVSLTPSDITGRLPPAFRLGDRNQAALLATSIAPPRGVSIARAIATIASAGMSPIR